MANYTQLLAAIRAAIKQNGTNDITGQLLQDTLCALVGSVGRYAQFAGVAIPNTNPGTPDQNVFYLTSTPGTYANFGGIVVPPDRLVALHNISGSWEMLVLVTFSDGSTISIDPALDLNSVNPVENRAVTAAINGLDTRITALEQSDVLYNKYVVLYAASANRAMVCTIALTDNNANIISNLDELVSPYFYPILQSDYSGIDTDDEAIAIKLVSGGAAVVMESLRTTPYISTWDIPAGGTSFVTSAVLPTRH